MVVLGLMFNGLEPVRDGIEKKSAAIKRRLSCRVALFVLVAVLTVGAIAWASQLVARWPSLNNAIISVMEISEKSPPSEAPTPAPRGREVPSEWQLRTRSSPELAAQYPFADLYTEDEIAYFKEIAFGIAPSGFSAFVPAVAEAAADNRASVGEGIQKWDGRLVTYYLDDELAVSDVEAVVTIISLLDALIPTLDFRRVTKTSDPSLLIGLVTTDHITDDELLDASKWPLTRVLTVIFDDPFAHFKIVSVLVYINSEWSAEVRGRPIIAGITGALGLTGSSWSYPDSIFYEGASSRAELADIDEALIRLLYDPRIKPGMTIEDLERMGL